jgi:autotransporter-associated beta strand protein
VSKVNAGLAVFSNTNTYTGTTAISTGQLRVTGSLAAGSAVTVSGSGTLIGAGTVNGTVLVQTGGGVSPGATGTTIATLTLGATTLDSGSTYTVNLDSAASPNSDRISTGALSLGGTLSINSLSNYRVGKSYLIASAPSITGIFAGLPQGTLIPFGGRLFMIQYTATDVLLRDTRNKNTFLPLFN